MSISSRSNFPAEGFQQFLTAPELGAVRGNGGLFQQGKQRFSFLRQIVADGEVQWFHATPPLGIFLYYMAYAQKSQFVKYQFCRRLRHLSYWKPVRNSYKIDLTATIYRRRRKE